MSTLLLQRLVLLGTLVPYALSSAAAAQGPGALAPASLLQAREDVDAAPWMLVEGDILVPPGGVLRSSLGGVPWPGGVVPYAFHASTTPANQAVALDAMAEWAARADLTFVLRTTQTNYISIQSSGTNSSPVGMIGGGQILRIVSWGSLFTVVHEFGHALGLWHEQTRFDRDDHVEVHFENMLAGAEHNWDFHASGSDHGPYDFASVMHYAPCTASECANCLTVPGCETTLPRLQYGRLRAEMGQRSYVSDGDARGMGSRYGFSLPDCNANHVDDDYELIAGDCNGNGQLDVCETDCNGNGVPDACDILFGASQDLDHDQVPDECAGAAAILFVDASAGGANDGSSWTDAFVDLQDALALADAAPGTVDEVWVADGSYRPGSLRTDAFELVNGVALFGGFAGGESALAQRAVDLHAAVLDGDLLGNDGPSFLNRSDNSKNVLLAPAGVDRSAVLDGFVVRGGNADAGATGGGLRCQGSPTVRNCTFTDNEGTSGGAVAIDDADPALASCSFVANRAGRGGALFSSAGYPVLQSCVFAANQSTSTHGGAVATERGGAWAANCTFHGNSAATFGGGWAHAGPNEGGAVLRNCILWANVDAGGADESAQVDRTAGVLEVNHCCVQGWSGALGGVGSFGADPLFVDAMNGDLRLAGASPCIDVGENELLPRDVADLDRDGVTFEDAPFDRDGRRRFLGRDALHAPAVDLGAYERAGWTRLAPHAAAHGLANDP